MYNIEQLPLPHNGALSSALAAVLLESGRSPFTIGEGSLRCPQVYAVVITDTSPLGPTGSPGSVTESDLFANFLGKVSCDRRRVRYIRVMLSAALSRAPETKRHRVLVVGGLERLQQEYRCCGNEQVTVDVANANSSRLGTSVSHSDSVVVVVTRVSHAAVQVVHRHARSRNLPIAHATSSSARHISETILQLTQKEGNG